LGLNIEVNDDGPSWIGRPMEFLCRRGFEAIIGQAPPSRPARPVSDEKFGGLIARNQFRT